MAQFCVDSLSHDFKGVSKRNGKACFIDNSLPNEIIEAQQVQTKKSFELWDAVEIIQNSEHRIIPECEYYSDCGGCQWQYCEHEAQIAFKQEKLYEQFQRLAKAAPLLEDVKSSPIESKPWGYRRKVRLSTSYDRRASRLQIGFRQSKNKDIVEISQCLVAEPRINEIISKLGFLNDLDAVNKIGHIEIFCGDKDSNTLLTVRIAINSKDFTDTDKQKLEQWANGVNLLSVDCVFNDTSRHFPERNQALSFYKVGHHTVEVLAGDFVQGNAEVNEKLITKAVSMLNLNSDDNVAEFFCGIGNFSLAIADKCNRLFAYEGSSASIQKAVANKERNKLSNIDFNVADLNSEFKTKYLKKQKVNKVLLDPPRDGALELIKEIVTLKPKFIVYVSCNTSTLARDAKILLENRYSIIETCLVDMFPHTKHSESITLFRYR